MFLAEIRAYRRWRVDEDLGWDASAREALDSTSHRRLMDDVQIEVTGRVRCSANDRSGRDDADRINLAANKADCVAQSDRIALGQIGPGTSQ
jgi:hypothetical protein